MPRRVKVRYEYGTFAYPVPAQVVGDVVQALETRDGLCTPQALIEEARPVSAALHTLFEWDDEVAAEGYRRQQARRLIRAVRVVVDGEQSAPAFVHATVDVSGYANLGRVLADEDLTNQMLGEALRYLNGARQRYKLVKALRPVWDALDEVAASSGVEG